MQDSLDGFSILSTHAPNQSSGMAIDADVLDGGLLLRMLHSAEASMLTKNLTEMFCAFLYGFSPNCN
jgi:hypothetical protein